MFRDNTENMETEQRKLNNICYNEFLNKNFFRMKSNVQNVQLKEVPNYQISRDQVKQKISEHKIKSTPTEISHGIKNFITF